MTHHGNPSFSLKALRSASLIVDVPSLAFPLPLAFAIKALIAFTGNAAVAAVGTGAGVSISIASSVMMLDVGEV